MGDPVVTVLGQLALLSFPLLVGVVLFFLKKERDTTEEQVRALRAEITRESANRAVEVAALQRDLNTLQREVDKDYVNFERLEQIIRPLRASLDGLVQTVVEGQREIFNKLDGKQDKRP